MKDMTELIDDFLNESNEMLDAVTDDVLDLEGGHDQDAINRIFRAIHSAKGNAAMLGFDNMSKFAHEAEDCFSEIRSGRRLMNKESANLVLRCLDELRKGLEVVGATDEDGYEYPSLISRGNEKTNADVEVKHVGQSNLAKAGATSSPCSREKLRVLVVEDDYVSRKVLVNHFSKLGECHVAKDGLEAIQAVVEGYEEDVPRSYDLICMDIMMPVMDGYKAARTIREIERGKGVANTLDEAVIFMTTAVSDKTSLVKAVNECGANKYFIKPVELNEVQQQLNVLLARTEEFVHIS